LRWNVPANRDSICWRISSTTSQAHPFAVAPERPSFRHANRPPCEWWPFLFTQLNHRPAILRPASALAWPCLVPPAICLQATSQRPAMAFPFPFPSRPCLRPASLWPPVASGLSRPPSSQPRPARGHPGGRCGRGHAQRPARPARTPASTGGDQPASRRSGQPASALQAIQPASTGGDQQAIEASQHQATSTRPEEATRTWL
jgi:hypothetical protein